MPLFIRPMQLSDWPLVAQIYAEGIDTGVATFETQVPTYADWDKSHTDYGRLIAEVDGQVAGWAALTPVSSRCVYAGVAEVSVYVAACARGQGVGRALLQALIATSEQQGLWTLEAVIFSENLPSIALHRSVGFRLIGYQEKIGQLEGGWRDITLMERRSKSVGI